MKCLYLAACMAVCVVGNVMAAPISFSAAEGYTIGGLDGQPGSGSTWSCTANVPTSIFSVSQSAPAPHQDFLRIQISNEHGTSSELVTPDYATKRMIPVTSTFEAFFTCRMNGRDDATDQTAIALGQTADSGWGPYFGFNKTGAASLAVHEGTGWTELVSGLDASKWYDVEISGDVGTGLFNVKIYDEAVHNANPALGLLYDDTHSFRDSPTELAYVMLTNEGSGQDTGAGSHTYDDLDLIPEPTTMGLLGLGLAGIVGRRKRE